MQLEEGSGALLLSEGPYAHPRSLAILLWILTLRCACPHLLTWCSGLARGHISSESVRGACGARLWVQAPPRTTVPTKVVRSPRPYSCGSSLVKWPCPLLRLTISALGDGWLPGGRGLALPVVGGRPSLGLGTQQIPTKGSKESRGSCGSVAWAAL